MDDPTTSGEPDETVSLAEAVARARLTADADLTVDDILQVIDANRRRELPPTQS